MSNSVPRNECFLVLPPVVRAPLERGEMSEEEERVEGAAGGSEEDEVGRCSFLMLWLC